MPRGKKEEQSGIDWEAQERAAIENEGEGEFKDEIEQETGIPPAPPGYTPPPDDGESGEGHPPAQGDHSRPEVSVEAARPAVVEQRVVRSNPHAERVQTFGAMLQKALPQFGNVVPKGFDPQRLIAIALSAIERSPGLLECTGISVLRCILIAGQLGLEVSGVTGQAYLVPYTNRKTNKKEAQLIIGYRGYTELARRGGVGFVHAQPVYQNEQFSYEINPIPRIYHKPYPLGEDEKDRGPLVGAYAVAIYKDPTIPPQPCVMSLKAIERARSSSASSKYPDSPWNTHFEEMVKKTPVRALAKMMPQTPELASAIDLEERQERGEELSLPGEAVVGELPEAEPERPPTTSTAKLSRKLKGTH